MSFIRSWSAAGDDETFAAYDLRRGFLGDRMYDAVVAFLVARGAFEWMGTHLAAGSNAELLANIYTAAVSADLFVAERRTLEELAHVRVTVRMLEGV
jgi:hypothetical protein